MCIFVVGVIVLSDIAIVLDHLVGNVTLAAEKGNGIVGKRENGIMEKRENRIEAGGVTDIAIVVVTKVGIATAAIVVAVVERETETEISIEG